MNGQFLKERNSWDNQHGCCWVHGCKKTLAMTLNSALLCSYVLRRQLPLTLLTLQLGEMHLQFLLGSLPLHFREVAWAFLGLSKVANTWTRGLGTREFSAF